MDGDKGVISRGAALDIKCHQEMEENAGLIDGARTTLPYKISRFHQESL